MKRWKERDTDVCPRCGIQEDAPHVLVCSGEGATEVWAKSILNLEEWMISVDTDPDIMEMITWKLNKWSNSEHPPIVIDDIWEHKTL